MSTLVGLAGAAWARISGWCALAGAAVAMLAAVWLAGQRDGRRRADAEMTRRAGRAREIRDEIDRNAARTADAAGELQRDWRRP